MDFIDNAISTAKDAFEVACKKTDEIVTAQKLKFDIASLKTKRSKDYEKLGAIYFKAIENSDIEDESIKAAVEAIKSKNNQIKDLSAQLEAAKNNENDE